MNPYELIDDHPPFMGNSTVFAGVLLPHPLALRADRRSWARTPTEPGTSTSLSGARSERGATHAPPKKYQSPVGGEFLPGELENIE